VQKIKRRRLTIRIFEITKEMCQGREKKMGLGPSAGSRRNSTPGKGSMEKKKRNEGVIARRVRD